MVVVCIWIAYSAGGSAASLHTNYEGTTQVASTYSRRDCKYRRRQYLTITIILVMNNQRF